MIHDYELSYKAEYRVAEMSPNFTNISDALWSSDITDIFLKWAILHNE